MRISQEPSLRRLFQRIHDDEAGAVSLEVILVIGLIALPVLFFVYKYGWPAIQSWFKKGANDVGIDIETP